MGKEQIPIRYLASVWGLMDLFSCGTLWGAFIWKRRGCRTVRREASLVLEECKAHGLSGATSSLTAGCPVWVGLALSFPVHPGLPVSLREDQPTSTGL